MSDGPTERFARFAESRAAPVLLLAVAAVVFAAVSLRPLTHSEFRYVEAGVEMAKGGDWVVPHLAFVPYFEKPILTYWAEAAAQLAFGAGAVAVRLVASVPCLVMLWTTYEFGRRSRGRAFGLGAAALLLASVYFTAMGSVATTDPLFSAGLALAWYAFFRHDRAPTGRWIWVFWAALGLAVLTKGPLALVFAGLSIGAYLALSGRVRDVLAMRPARGVAVVLAVNLPWSLLVWRRDPRFLEFFYVRENFEAFFNGRINHPGPFWYYLPLLVGAFFPFALLAAWALGDELWTTFRAAARRLVGRGAAPPDDGRLYLGCMLLPPLLFLSASSSKLGTYFLPLVPGAALLVAGWIADRVARPGGVLRFALAVQTGVLAAALGFLPLYFAKHADVAAKAAENKTVLACAVGLIFLGCATGGVATARRRVVLGLLVAGASTTAGLLVAIPSVESLSSDADAAALMPRLVAARHAGERVVLAGTCSEDFSVVLALGERVAVWGAARELGMGHFAEVTPPSTPIPKDPYDVGGPLLPLPENPWLLDDARLAAAWRSADRAWFVGRPKDVDKLRAAGLAVHVLAENDSRSIVTNRPLPSE